MGSTVSAARELPFDDPREWGYEDLTAIFFGLYQPLPVYHGYDWNRRDDDPDVSRDFTRCGRVTGEYDHTTRKLREPGTPIPMRHAIRFGRPCARCFPTEEAE